MSTGTSTFEEIKDSIKYADLKTLYLLHCVSSYPCEPKIANIKRMNWLKTLTPQVGYSDHIQGVESAKVAIEFGAQVLEKHFTIDNNLPGRDNKFAILPSDLANLSSYMKLRNEMLINHGVDYQECETDSRNNYTGRFNG
jgi:sialic acid synthase SpsE